MPSAADIERHFATGAETITLTREEWRQFYERAQGYAATGRELRQALAETERVKRIAVPLWRAVARVRRSMAKTFERCPGRAERIPRCDVEGWERILRHAQDVDWQDLPAGHRKVASYRR